MFYFFKNLKNTCRKSDFTLLKNSDEISSEKYHNECSKKTEQAREERIEINSLSESSKKSPKKAESDNPRDMEENYISRITDIILRGFRSKREHETTDDSETARDRSNEANHKTRHRGYPPTNTKIEHS